MSATQVAYVSRRDPRIVSFFKPYEAGDVVKLGEKDWTVAHDVSGWYLTDTGNYKGMHETIRDIRGMIDLIGLVERAFLNEQLAPA